MNDLHNVVIKKKVKQKLLLAFDSFIIQLLGGAWCCLLLWILPKQILKFFEFAVYSAQLLHCKSERPVLALKMGPFR